MRILTIATVIMLSAAPAHAGVEGLLEAGVGVAMPVADGSYSDRYATSPTLWLAGVYLPRYADRRFGVEIGFELTPYQDDYQARGGATTEFTRLRAQVGGRYFLPFSPQLIGFGRALVGGDLFSVNQVGRVGTKEFESIETDVGIALELGAGVMYQWSSLSIGGQLAVPVSIHNQVRYDSGPAINHVGFDLELRFTIGTSY